MQVVLCLGIFSYILYIAKACSCIGKPHFQTYACEAEYVIKVRVLDKEEIYEDSNEQPISSIFNIIPRNPNPDEIKYTIQVLREFKVSPGYKEAAKDTIYTEGTESFCGVNLQVGSKYLITGISYDGQLRTSLCDLVKKWRVDQNIIDNNHVLTRKQVRFFRKEHYLNNCNCPVNDCTQMGCFMGPIPSPSPYCLLLGEESSCQKNYSFCKKTTKNGCQWRPNKMLDLCLSSFR